MANRKQMPHSLRYFKARIQPFRNPLFLTSIGVIALSAMFIVQYMRNPALLSPSKAQFRANDNANDNEGTFGATDPKTLPEVTSSTQAEPGRQRPEIEGLDTPLSVNPNQDLQTFENWVPSPLDPLAPNGGSTSDNDNDNSVAKGSKALPGSNDKLLEQASLENYSSLFQRNLQNNRESPLIRPVEPVPVESLPENTALRPPSPSPLQRAVDQVFQTPQPAPSANPNSERPALNQYPNPFVPANPNEFNNSNVNQNPGLANQLNPSIQGTLGNSPNQAQPNSFNGAPFPGALPQTPRPFPPQNSPENFFDSPLQ